MCRANLGRAIKAVFVLLWGVSAHADQIKLDVALSHPVLKADQKQTTYLKVSLTGFRFKQQTERPAVNVAIVIDKSGSMSGEKIRKAKEAAVMAIKRLNSRDIVSVIAYSDTVEVLVPATKLSDKAAVYAAIERLYAGGSTALFAGVSKGACELRKFLDKNRVNRVILLSDGIANVGPSSPTELGRLGASLIKERISVTTIGLGTDYNEDLMSKLATTSDANHYFAENAVDLVRVFNNELGDVLSVVAQEVLVTIQISEGIRPVRVLGRDADITGQLVSVYLNQLYSEQQKYILLEVEVPATPAERVRPVARVNVSYANMQTKTTDRLGSSLAVRFTPTDAIVAQKRNTAVMISVVEQIATDNNEKAMRLRDQGKIKEAREALKSNAKYLDKHGVVLESEALGEYAEQQLEDASNLEGQRWRASRKKMIEEQSIRRSQRKR